MKTRSRQSGFTLLEILVATVILAVMGMIAYRGIAEARVAVGHAEGHLDRLRQVQRTVQIVVTDFRTLSRRPVREPIGDGLRPTLLRDPNAMALVELSRAGWPNGAGTPRGTAQRVIYRLEEGKLIREHWNVMDATLATPPMKRELIDRVERVDVRYMTNGARVDRRVAAIQQHRGLRLRTAAARDRDHAGARGLRRDSPPRGDLGVRQRGVALITAIVVVAIATVLAVRIGTRAALDLRRTAGLVALDQGWHVALGAEAWAIEVLKDDYEDSQGIDHLGEAWAQPLPPLPVDGGEVRGALEDMQGRFNLNNLVNRDREVNQAEVDRFRRLLVMVGAQPRWASLMADWIDENSMTEPEGAEDGTYMAQNPPYRTANGLVATTTEMMALPGMTRDEFERIRPYVAALPAGTAINLCTAKAPLLAALSEGGAEFGNDELLAAEPQGRLLSRPRSSCPA